jgi:hypothetical protein
MQQQARIFFSSLKWNYLDSNYNSPIFTIDEIKTLPLKWMKYLLLEKVGLTSGEQLRKTIIRYKIYELENIENRCKEFYKNGCDYSDKMIVFKVVFMDMAGQLPNYRIYNEHEIPNAIKFVKSYLNNAYEIWICSSNVDKTGKNFGGRITMPVGDNLTLSFLEIIWFSTPRRIEEFKKDGFAFPYIRVMKHIPSLCFNLEELYIPKKYEELVNSQDLLKDIQWVLSNLYYLRNQVEMLKEILHGAGANELSLEFKSSDGNFSVIDWDTEIETFI